MKKTIDVRIDEKNNVSMDLDAKSDVMDIRFEIAHRWNRHLSEVWVSNDESKAELASPDNAEKWLTYDWIRGHSFYTENRQVEAYIIKTLHLVPIQTPPPTPQIIYADDPHYEMIRTPWDLLGSYPSWCNMPNHACLQFSSVDTLHFKTREKYHAFLIKV